MKLLLLLLYTAILWDKNHLSSIALNFILFPTFLSRMMFLALNEANALIQVQLFYNKAFNTVKISLSATRGSGGP